MRLDGDGHRANLGHAILRGVLGVLIDDALALVRLGPELFKEAIVDPSISRSRKRFRKDAAVMGIRNVSKGKQKEAGRWKHPS